MKRALAVVLVLGALAALEGGAAGALAGASSSFRPCAPGAVVLCASVAVPLDWTGRHPGSITLHAEELPPLTPPPANAPPKIMFMVAGGPGQASAEIFRLADSGGFWRELFPGYTLVVYDDRGTGRSGRIICDGLGRVLTTFTAASAKAVGACGRSLGAGSSLYSTRANAGDLDAVRQALGVDRVSLFGVSYGTKQVLGYALVHPSHVERIVLDSVAAPEWPGSFGSFDLQAIPHGLDRICRNACRGVTTNAGADFAKLADQLAADPIRASVSRPGGPPINFKLDGNALIELALDTDTDPGIAVSLPAAVAAALAGNPQAIERLASLDELAVPYASYDENLAVYVATTCTDGRFPWSPHTALAARPSLLQRAIATLPPGTTGPFGTWATSTGAAQMCEDWPLGTGLSSLPPGPFPDVPVLILSGSRDIRTPTAEARQVAAKLPRHRILVVDNSGHAVSEESLCADRFIAAWVQGKTHGGCPPVALPMAPLGPFPPPGELSDPALTPAQTFAVVASTLRDTQSVFFATEGLGASFGGLAGGTFTPLRSGRGFKLTRYADVAGVTLDGLVSRDRFAPGGWVAFLSVAGARASGGSVAFLRGKLGGVLGGKPVGSR